MKVLKFGGSSLSDETKIRKIREIIKGDSKRRYIVVSAPGKRYKNDVKITDMLLNCYQHRKNGEEWKKEFMLIRNRFNKIVYGLSVSVSIDELLDDIENNIEKGSYYDYVVSRGEYLNGIIVAKFMNFAFVDAKKCIFFNKNGDVDIERTYSAINEVSHGKQNIVFPGFYGTDASNGKIKVFTRGGSDITGALISAALDAELYENWTDVNGCLCASPIYIHNPRTIDSITFKEMREFSHMGASVLHEDAVFPLLYKNIKINIRNTEKPDEPGTIIEEYTANSCFKMSGKESYKVCHKEFCKCDNTEFVPCKDIIIRDCLNEAEKAELGILVIIYKDALNLLKSLLAKLKKENIEVKFFDFGAEKSEFYIGINISDYEKVSNIIYYYIEDYNIKNKNNITLI